MAQLRIEANETNFVIGLKKASGAVGELAGVMNIKLANSFKGADFYSRNFEKGLGRLSEQFKNTGQMMAIGLSLPLIFLGKSASDAYAELDSLKKGLATLEPTTFSLNARLKELREIAKAPGIGFQEAIQGDVRLRSVGISAEMSARALTQFANAVALTGGGKERLNEITIQLGQMAAKGKVLSQDLRPIIEAAPAIAGALKSIFGTVSSDNISDQLEKAGKSSTDMITMLLTELEKAPRVTGGWKNALENLGTTLFVAKAEMFEVADKLFDLQSIIASITSTVEGFVEGFKDLPESVQKTIIGLVALTAVLGPLAIGIGFVINAFTAFVSVGAITTGIVGGLVAIIGTLSYAFMDATAKANDMKKVNESIKSITQKATESISIETDKVMALVDILIDQKSSINDISSAKNALLRIDPIFKKALQGEKVDYDALEVATKKYIINLENIAKVKVLSERMVENERKKQKLTDDPKSAMGFMSNAWIKDAIGVGNKEYDKYVESTINGYTEANKKIAGAIAKINVKENIKAAAVVVPPSNNGKSADSIEKQKWQAEEKYRKMIREGHQKWMETLEKQGKAEEELDNDIVSNKIKNDDRILESKIKLFAGLASIKIATDEEKEKDKMFKELGIATPSEIAEQFAIRRNIIIAGMRKTSEDITKEGEDNILDAKKDAMNNIIKMKDELHETLGLMGVDFGSELISGLIGGDGLNGAFSTLMNSLGNLMIQFGKQALIANNAFKALKLALNLSPGGSLANGKAVALIFGGAIMKGIGSRVPKMAEGGMATNPTLAMIGDNRSGKEMVLPFEKTGQFASMIASQMGGGGGFIHTTRISGNDLLILTERAKRAK